MFSIRSNVHRLKDYFAFDQIKAFLDWCQSDPSAQLRAIYIDLGPRNYFCDCFGKNVSPTSAVQFVVGTPRALSEILSFLEIVESLPDWYPIFSSPFITIWENKRMHGSHPEKLPLRFGLTELEKEILLRNVRTAITYFLESEPNVPKLPLTEIPERLLYKTTVDVALWVRGHLRGSIIVEHNSLINGAKTAGRLATQDSRFKPLDLSELPHTTIQITVMGDLQLPLLHQEFKKNQIYTEKYYSTAAQSRKGWFVPAVFNCLTLHNLKHLITTLYSEKLKLTNQPNQNDIYIGEVDDFIESSKISSPSLSLKGPLVIKNDVPSLLSLVNVASEQLARIQESDGNIPPVIYPLTGVEVPIDWIRLAHTTFALLKFGLKTNNKISFSTGKKSYAYLTNTLYRQKNLDVYTRTLTLIYLNQAAELLQDSKNLDKCASDILQVIPNLPFEPILQSQLALHLIKKGNETVKATTIVESLLNDFTNKMVTGQEVDLASYAELISLLDTLGEKLKRVDFSTEAKQITSWYLGQQLLNGAFPSSNQSDFCYTRGTGKIFEVLAKRPELTQSQNEKLTAWFYNMQYTTENAYFIPETIRPKIIGAFRHDYQDQSTWIDATSHLLLAASV